MIEAFACRLSLDHEDPEQFGRKEPPFLDESVIEIRTLKSIPLPILLSECFFSTIDIIYCTNIIGLNDIRS